MIDYSPLTTPVDRAAVKAYRAAERAKPRAGVTSPVAQIVIVVAVAIVLVVILLGFLGIVVSAVVSARGSSPLTLIVPVVFAIVFLAVIAAVLRAAFSGTGWEGWYRLDRFAAANGMVFSRVDSNPSYPGSIFGQGDDRTVRDHLRSATGRFLDYGNYRYSTGSGKSRTTHNWGFLALQLDRALPNMVLDAKANNGMFGGTNLPAYFSKKQILHLEGDFDRYFTLYCPQQYERDALYVFTPDLMALLIDEAAPFDVEIIDTWMFVYSSSPFDLRQPATHQRLLGIVDTVGAKTLSQTERYTDERVGDFAANVVAPQGRRLKRGISVGAVILVALFVTIWGWSFLSDIVGSLVGR